MSGKGYPKKERDCFPLGIEAENHAREIKLLAARRIGELVPAVQGKRTDKEPVRISDKLPDHQRLSEFRKLAKIPMEGRDCFPIIG